MPPHPSKQNITKIGGVTEPKLILIGDFRQDHERAVQMIWAEKDHDLPFSGVVCSEDYAVSWCEADDPAMITCRHHYRVQRGLPFYDRFSTTSISTSSYRRLQQWLNSHAHSHPLVLLTGRLRIAPRSPHGSYVGP
jgi:hypothetical protein